MLHDLTYVWDQKKTKPNTEFVGPERRMVVAGSCEEGKVGRCW